MLHPDFFEEGMEELSYRRQDECALIPSYQPRSLRFYYLLTASLITCLCDMDVCC